MVLTSWAANADKLPNSLSIYYAVYKGSLKLGTINKILVRKGKTYRSTTETHPTPIVSMVADKVSEESLFEIKDGRIFPEKFTVTRSGRKSYQHTVIFDWPGKSLNYSNQRTEAMPAGVILDAGNMIYSYMLNPTDMKVGRTLHVVNGKEVEVHKLTDVREELLNTEIGNLKTLRIEQKRMDKPERTFTLWLALEKNYLPVKLIKTRKGRSTKLLISKVEGL